MELFLIYYVLNIKLGTLENQIGKKELEKIILCDVQEEIRPDLEKALENILNNSGYTGFKFEKKIDFVKLYQDKIS